MITIGIDPHKGTHTAAAVNDATGQFLEELTVPATDAGAEQLHTWAHRLAEGEELRFALEDVRNVSGRLERFLLARSELVLRVGTRLMVGTRKSARTFGKSDSIDALAIARAALREPGLPRATHEPALRELKLILDHREDLVSERTAIISRLRWHLHELDPSLEPMARTLNREGTRRGLSQRLGRCDAGVQVRICRELLARIGEITRAELALRAEIAALIRPLAPGLLAISGVGDLIAARLLVETGGDRFATDSQLARHAGCADRGLLGTSAPPPALTHGQPQTERGAPPGSADSGSGSSACQGLPRQEARRGQVHEGGVSVPQTTPGASGLEGAAGAGGCCCFSCSFLIYIPRQTVVSQRCSLDIGAIPNGSSIFVPEMALPPRRDSLTFGRPPHRQLWRGCAARLAGGEALPDVVVNGTRRNCRGRSRRERHFGGMDQGRAEHHARRRHLHGMERKSSSPSFFTERTLADFLAVSDRTVRNWIRRGELPSYKLGAARRIDPADVEDFLARHRDEAS